MVSSRATYRVELMNEATKYTVCFKCLGTHKNTIIVSERKIQWVISQ